MISAGYYPSHLICSIESTMVKISSCLPLCLLMINNKDNEDILGNYLYQCCCVYGHKINTVYCSSTLYAM